MKNNNAKHKIFAIIFAITIFLILSALAGCDADSVGQSNEDMTLDLTDPDVIAALLSASEGYDSWDEDSEEPELLELDGEPKKVWCLPLNCDEDKDGFAWECDRYIYDPSGPLIHKGNVPTCQYCDTTCTNCVAKQYTCPDEEHCMCPGESVPKYAIQFTEKRRCDHSVYYWDGWPHPVEPDEMEKLFHEYMTPTSPLEPREYRQIRPRQSERGFYGVDDDCDEYIDETEYVYKEFGNEVRDDGFTIRAVINDFVIRQYANHIVAVVYELDNINEFDKKLIMRGLVPKEWDGYKWVYKHKKMFGFPYNSDHRVDLEIRDKLAFSGDKKVYAVGLMYFRLVPTLPWLPPIPVQIGCVDSGGSPDYWFMFTGGTCSKRNRITSDIYYGAVGKSVDHTALHPELTKLRTAVTNRAIYEWNLSERGLVGGQDLDDLNYSPSPPMPHNPWVDIVLPNGTYPAVVGGASPAKAPDGTRYTADYGESWCTEFASSVFHWVSSEVPVKPYIENMTDWFYMDAIMRWDDNAREIIFYDRGEAYGSYLVMNARGDATGVYGSHGGIFLGLDGELKNVWRLHGCSDRRIVIDNEYKYNKMDNTDTWYYFMGIGQFTDQDPDLLPY